MPHIYHKRDAAPLTSEHGEVVYELIGKAVGGSDRHSLAHVELPPGKGSLKHYHPEAEESYYILSGEARLVLDEQTYTLTPGQSVVIAPGVVHQVFNDGAETLHFLAVCVPAWTPDNSVYLD